MKDFVINNLEFELSSAQLVTSCSDLVYTEGGEEDQKASRRVSIKFYVNVE